MIILIINWVMVCASLLYLLTQTFVNTPHQLFICLNFKLTLKINQSVHKKTHV